MKNVDQTRRRFMATFAGAGLGSTLLPGVLWARVQDSGAQKITLAMVNEALKISGVDVGEDEKAALKHSADAVQELFDKLKTAAA